VAWFATGVAMMTLMAASNTTLQLTARPDMRGRVIAFYMLLLMGSTPIGGPIVGFIAETAGPRWSVAMAAAATFVAAGIAFLPLHESPSEARPEPLAVTT
jgi:MFS family permease